MGFHDRHYMQDDYQEQGARSFGSGVSLGLPRLTPAVKFIIISCGAMFIAQLIFQGMKMPLSSVLGATGAQWWQPWRYLTFQFLHSTNDLMHIVFNMLGIYFLGVPLEQRWGTKRFLKFYLICGAFAGVAYVVVANLVNLGGSIPLIGASGGVFAIIFAAALLMPRIKLIFLFFPVPIRLASIIIFGGMIFLIIKTVATQGYGNPNFWSDVAHLGGVVPAAAWLWGFPKISNIKFNVEQKVQDGNWQRKMQKIQEEEAQVDAILDKIKDKGIASLTGKEKKILKQATDRQKKEDSRFR